MRAAVQTDLRQLDALPAIVPRAGAGAAPAASRRLVHSVLGRYRGWSFSKGRPMAS